MRSTIETGQFRAASPIDASGLVQGVSVITAGVEAKGHCIYIDAKTLETVHSVAKSFAGGIKVKLDHSEGMDKIVGYLKNFRIDGAQVRADLQLLKSHPAYNLVRELIEKQPATFGLSITFSSFKEKIDGRDFVRVTDLFSVDLVDSPAANPGGLFSAKTNPPLFGLDRVRAAFKAELERNSKATTPTAPKPAPLHGLERVRAAFRAQVEAARLNRK